MPRTILDARALINHTATKAAAGEVPKTRELCESRCPPEWCEETGRWLYPIQASGSRPRVASHLVGETYFAQRYLAREDALRVVCAACFCPIALAFVCAPDWDLPGDTLWTGQEPSRGRCGRTPEQTSHIALSATGFAHAWPWQQCPDCVAILLGEQTVLPVPDWRPAGWAAEDLYAL